MAKRLSDHPTLEELNDFFGHDRFAEHAGCRIVEGSRDHAVCELDIQDHHRNALGNVMGGAIFTLADFALAIASNTGGNPSVSVSSTIEYLSASKGTRLIATCTADKSGRRLGVQRAFKPYGAPDFAHGKIRRARKFGGNSAVELEGEEPALRRRGSNKFGSLVDEHADGFCPAP